MGCKMISIDSSTNKTGYAVWEDGKFVRSGLIDLSKSGKDMTSRLPEMMKQITTLLSEEKADLVYVEEMNVTRNAQVGRFLVRLQGAIQYWCAINDKWFETIQPTKWRKAIELKGKSRKREDMKQAAIEHVDKEFGLQVNDDEAEAICIGQAVLKLYS